jgi:hypothetical protein
MRGLANVPPNRPHGLGHPSAVLLLLATLAQVPAGHAQTCFAGRPLPGCRSFPILELGYAHRLDGGPTATGATPQVHYLNGELGWAFNRSPRLALGGALFAGALVDYAFELRPGLKARARYWLGARTGLDVGAGMVLGRVPADRASGSPEERKLGGVAHVGLSLHDALHLTLQTEYVPNPVDRDLVGYIGARLGSKPALWSAIIVGPLLGLGAIARAN